MFMYSARVCLAFGALLGALRAESPRAAAGESNWRERFMLDRRNAWDEYRTRSSRLQGVVLRSNTMIAPYPEKTRMRLELKQREGCMLFLGQRFQPDSGGDPKIEYPREGTLIAVNPKYAFALRRAADGLPWAISWVDTQPADGIPESPERDVHALVRKPVSLDWVAAPIDVDGPSFHVDDVVAAARNEKDLVKVAFRYRDANAAPRAPTTMDGWVLLDPENYWVIREFAVQITWAFTKTGPMALSGTYEYARASDGFPILKRMLVTQKNPDTSFDGQNDYELDLHEMRADEADFTLSAFGFPEPVAAKRGTSWYLWAALFGIVFLVLAALLRRRAVIGRR